MIIRYIKKQIIFSYGKKALGRLKTKNGLSIIKFIRTTRF